MNKMLKMNLFVKVLKTFGNIGFYPKTWTQSRNFQRATCLATNFNNAFRNQTNGNLGKVFVESENQYAHKVLENSVKPYYLLSLEVQQESIPDLQQLPDLVRNPPEESEATPIEELFRNFCLLAEYCRQQEISLADQRFTKFIDLYCKASHLLSDDQLVETLKQMATMPLTKSTTDLNFAELWNNLDLECEHRIPKWDSERLLLVSDAWYRLHLGRVSEFVGLAIRKLGRKVLKMPPEQLVQTMFFCNILRKPVLDMFNFEVNLEKCAPQLSLEELGVMAMGFFKTETPIRNPKLLEHLYKRLMEEIDTVADITLVSVLKILKYSTKLKQSALVTQLMEKLCSQIDRLSLLSCLHAALLGTDLQIYHETLLDLVVERFIKELPKARLKDMERICFVIAQMNYTNPNGLDRVLCKSILETLPTRMDEIMRHPRSLPLCLHFLSLKGFHDKEMISSVLDPRYINHAFGKNLSLGREIFQLDSFVKINLKDSNYDGHQLSEKHRAKMGKILTNYIPDKRYKLNLTDRILVEIKESLERLYKTSTFKHILPHFERPDVVLCYDTKKRVAVPIDKGCPEDYSGQILTRKELLGEQDNNPDLITIAIVIAGWNNLVRGSETLTGLFDLKLNQLRILGHKYIVIYWYEWRELETSDRQKFLQRKLSSLIK